MQLIMQPAAPPSLAISTAPAPPSCIPDHHDVHNESSSRPSFCPSPAINSAPPSSHGASPPRLPPDCIPISSAHNLSPAPGALLPSYSLIPLQGGPDQAVPSHCCKSCNRNFSCSHALGAHMHAHDSFYALCEGAGSSADIMSKADNQQDPNQKQNDSKENELLIDLSSSCKSETEDQYEEDELLYVVRRKPKRSRHSVDREDLPSKSVNVAGNDIHESVGRIVRAGSFKKPMFTCKLQDRPPPACTECGREFNSWKALFGHMRCHPEREWRGIQPPAEHIQNGARALKDSIARNSTLESNSFIVVKPLRTSKQCDMLKRKDMSGQCRSGQPAAYPSHELIKANCNQSKEEDLAADDTVLAGSIREDGLKLSWNSCRKQVMLEEEEESDTESIEAAYMSSNFKDEEEKCLHLLASFSRGKRSKRSHFTVKSLRSVQDKLAAKVAEGENEPKDEDLEMANCLVMLALAGSVGSGDREGGTASKSIDHDIDDDDDDVYEGTVDDQLKLTWGSNGCTTGDDSELKIPPYQNDMITTASNLDDAIINAGEGGKYECAACKRSFKSHQALGGHRASHKKVKGCFAKTAVDVEAFPMTSKDGIAAASTTYFDPSMLTLAAICKEHIATSTPHLGTSPPEMKGGSKHSIETGGMCTGGVPAYDVSGGHTVSGKLGGLNKAVGAANFTEKGSSIQLLLGSMDGLTSRSSSKLALHNPSKSHQCSICQRVFSSGQALGGHKRCHWAADKADRHALETGTGISAMACVAAPPTGVAKLTFFTRPPAVEEATHHEVKVLGIDLNIPASFDVDPVNSPNAIKANTCKNNRSLGSLLSLGHCSGVSTIHAPIDVNDESFQSAGRYMAGQSSTTDPVACSGSSSPSSTTSIHVSETGPCL